MKSIFYVAFSFIGLFQASGASWWGSSSKGKEGSEIAPVLPTTEMFRTLLGNVMSTDTHFPRIFRTPTTYNAIFDLPGFYPQDIHVSLDEDTIHVEGHTWCPKTEQSTSWFGEKMVSSDRDLCIERHVNAHVTLPRSMHEHGDVNAILENGVLRVMVPLQKEERKGYARKLVDVLTGGAKSVQNAAESAREGIYGSAEQAREGAYEAAKNTFQGAKEGVRGAAEKVREGAERVKEAAGTSADYVQDTAREAAEKGKQYGDEYIKKPLQYTGANAAEKVRDAGQRVAEQAEEVRQKVRPGIVEETSDQAKGIYERASEAIHNAAETVMHPFRKSGGPDTPIEKAQEYAQDMYEHGKEKLKGAREYGSGPTSERSVPVKEGKVVNEL